MFTYHPCLSTVIVNLFFKLVLVIIIFFYLVSFNTRWSCTRVVPQKILLLGIIIIIIPDYILVKDHTMTVYYILYLYTYIPAIYIIYISNMYERARRRIVYNRLEFIFQNVANC